MATREYRNEWGRKIATSDGAGERAQRVCACGCGGVIPDIARKDKIYISNAHRMRHQRKAGRTREHLCACGCGKPVTGQNKRYATSACRQRAYRQRVAFENRPTTEVDA